MSVIPVLTQTAVAATYHSQIALNLWKHFGFQTCSLLCSWKFCHLFHLLLHPIRIIKVMTPYWKIAISLLWRSVSVYWWWGTFRVFIHCDTVERDLQSIHLAYLNIDGVKMFSILMIVNTVIVISCTYIISKWSMSYNQKYILLLGMVMDVVGYANVTHSKHHLPVYPNLLNQQFKVSQPGSVWVADITYVYTKEGWLYLATVMDLFSCRIIG